MIDQEFTFGKLCVYSGAALADRNLRPASIAICHEENRVRHFKLRLSFCATQEKQVVEGSKARIEFDIIEVLGYKTSKPAKQKSVELTSGLKCARIRARNGCGQPTQKTGNET